ncbi:hypothetical protein HID58_091847 [Brassica napus]|uniref:Uncharacterized protein n=1 Tax=Brassica napus TaxID=3708 RepID=A0ABQ7WYF6_BRANA|nr:hypothetical protein HID58_091847 [Brassica napus]
MSPTIVTHLNHTKPDTRKFKDSPKFFTQPLLRFIPNNHTSIHNWFSVDNTCEEL